MAVRILFLLTQDLDSPSGQGRYLPLAQGLARLGHAVHIAALHADFASLTTTSAEEGGVQVEYVAPMHVRKHGSHKTYYPAHQLLPLAARATWCLGRAALNTPADVIHIGKPHPMNSVAGLVAGLVRRSIVFLDCDDYEVASARFGGAWQRWGVALFEDNVPRSVHHVTTNTLFQRERLLRLGVPPSRITYLPNGVDVQRFNRTEPDKGHALRERLGLSGKQVVAFIGSLSTVSHPVELLLSAFGHVHKARPTSILLLIGGGEDYARLQEQARAMGLGECVVFTGRVPRAEIPNYYQVADVSVDPVYDDDAARGRSPLKLFESWAAGVPFVTADVGDRRQLLGTPPAGILVKPGDADALAAGILEVLSAPELALELRKRGQQRALDYDWSRLARKAEAIYLATLASRQRVPVVRQ
jgi:glycosyltransferase involved in cell wall biosynthesis